jgi:carbon-monoxide dehydrogenase large subunit
VVQGIGTALFEELGFDGDGLPTARSFLDYLLPGAGDVPTVFIEHMETASRDTAFGIKGMGEGGAIPPPAALANAVNDALSGLGAEILEVPLTPRRVLAAIRGARRVR